MNMKRDYYEDIEFLSGRNTKIWFVILLIALISFPLWASTYFVYVASLIGVNILVILGLNILVGNTGQISLGHAGFVAIGAYSLVILQMNGVVFPFAILIAGVISSLFGFMLGMPALRLDGPYLAVATLAFGLAIEVIIGRIGFFGGHMGLRVGPPDFLFLEIQSESGIYYLILFFLLIGAIFARNIIRGKTGRAFQAIRDSSVAASAMGVNIAKYKTLSFAVSAFYAGIAGGLWAVLMGFINPGQFNFVLSIQYLAMVVVGGLGTIAGSIFGAVAITLLMLQAESIQLIPVVGPFLEMFSEQFMTRSGMPNITWVLTGLALMLIVLFEPLGLYGIWIRCKLYWKTWPF